MLVLVVVVGLIVAVQTWFNSDTPDPAPAIDFAPAQTQARSMDIVAPAPDPMPKGWKATSVTFRQSPNRWHLGILTAEKEYVGIETSDNTDQPSLAAKALDGDPVKGSTRQLGSSTWQVWAAGKNEHGLTTQIGNVIVFVGGSAPMTTLVGVASTLELR